MRVLPRTASCDDAIRARNVPYNDPAQPGGTGQLSQFSSCGGEDEIIGAVLRIAPIATDELGLQEAIRGQHAQRVVRAHRAKTQAWPRASSMRRSRESEP